jgi:putative tricarboxylic transport membrane protein
MGEGMLSALGLLSPELLLFMLLGVVVATAIAVIPGLSGVVALALLIPLVFVLEPLAGFAMLIAAVASTGTGNTITACLFGMPGTPSGTALIFDGYPMSQRGEGSRAVAAGLTASGLGGIFGALVLALLIPVGRQVVLIMSSPEFFVLILLALAVMAAVSKGNQLKTLASGFLGLVVGMVGMEGGTGEIRFTFGQLYLWSGVPMVPAMLGMYAIAEMLRLSTTGGSIAQTGSAKSTMAGTMQGVRDTFRHWPTVLRGSSIGAGIGLLPGVGQMVAAFLAYGQAARTSKNKDKFGTGEVEGVIAPDSATNATDGGQLVPTLAFGIPGGSSMAVLLAGITILGFKPGPEMMSTNVQIMWLAVFVLVGANIMAVTLSLGLSPLLAKLTFLRGNLLVPGVLGMAAVGAFTSTGHIGDIVILLLGGAVGYLLYLGNYSRTLFVVALVLGPILEQHFFLSLRVFGPGFLFARPIAAVLTVLLVVMLVGPPLRRAFTRRRPRRKVGTPQ